MYYKIFLKNLGQNHDHRNVLFHLVLNDKNQEKKYCKNIGRNAHFSSETDNLLIIQKTVQNHVHIIDIVP